MPRRPRRPVAKRRAGRPTLSVRQKNPEPAHARHPFHNLPSQLTSFVGREREIAEIKRLLTTTRLLTLTGSGGCGKTRLALQVAADVVDQYSDGVWLVELAPLSDPTFVPNSVAAALDIPEQPDRPLNETLAKYLQAKNMLLLLDNCEHLRPACQSLVDKLLRASPAVRILATSREALRVEGELTYRVPSLRLPDVQRIPTAAQLAEYDAVRLFVDRAVLSRPEFTVTEGNASAVARICQQLDGMPLAIEFAAARVSVLSVEQLAARLDDRFRLLTAGTKRTLPRQQTLRATLDWSYELLSEHERVVLRRLSVFAGGWTLEAAEGVCAGDPLEPSDVFDLLSQLVEKSLVLADTEKSEGRYRLLETVRQYALNRLAESGEETDVRRRHRDWYLCLVEQADPALRGPAQNAWLERLGTEHDNLRAALEWSAIDPDGAGAGLRLAGLLTWFWFLRGHWGEGRMRLDSALARSTEAPLAALPVALQRATFLAWRQNDFPRARELGEQGLALCRRLGDDRNTAMLLVWLAVTAQREQHYEGATPLHQEAVTLARALGDRWITATALSQLGIIARNQGNCDGAIALHTECLQLCKEIGDGFAVAYNWRNLGDDALELGAYERAESCFIEGLKLGKQVAYQSYQWIMGECLEGLAGVACSRGQHERSARLFAAVDVLNEMIGHRLAVLEQVAFERLIASARRGLGDAAFEEAWALGRAMTLEQAAQYAVAAFEQGKPPGGAQPTKDRGAALRTRREGEVARLVVAGQTNREIAASLVISERTADAHVQNILNKLGFTSRAQIAAWAVERGLTGTPKVDPATSATPPQQRPGQVRPST